MQGEPILSSGSDSVAAAAAAFTATTTATTAITATTTAATTTTAADRNHKDAFDTMGDLEQELHRTIHRSFAFDEWDDEGSACDRTRKYQQDAAFAPSGSFVPIHHQQPNDSGVVRSGPSPKKLPSILPFGIANTGFKLVTPPTAVTPSPHKRNHKIERPVPLYSHQSLDCSPNRFAQTPTTTTTTTPTRSTSTTPKHDLPKNHQSLESMLRASFEPSLPLPCESIPRQASAFSIPEAFSMENDGNEEHQEQMHWFDMYGSGTTLFEDDDYVFESPTSISEEEEDSLYASSTIPRCIVCYNNNNNE